MSTNVSRAKDVERARQIVEGILALQRKIFKDQVWLEEEVAKSKGNVAHLEVYSLDGAYSKTFELGDDMVIRESTRDPKHSISCHIDVLLDLISGEMTMGDAYTQGLIQFEGENFHAHAWKWSRYFSRVQRYLKAVNL